MKAARSRMAVIARVAAATVLALAQLQLADRAMSADGVRERAEDLAQAASRRFSEVMQDERGSRLQGKQAPATRLGFVVLEFRATAVEITRQEVGVADFFSRADLAVVHTRVADQVLQERGCFVGQVVSHRRTVVRTGTHRAKSGV